MTLSQVGRALALVHGMTELKVTIQGRSGLTLVVSNGRLSIERDGERREETWELEQLWVRVEGLLEVECDRAGIIRGARFALASLHAIGDAS